MLTNAQNIKVPFLLLISLILFNEGWEIILKWLVSEPGNIVSSPPCQDVIEGRRNLGRGEVLGFCLGELTL